MKARLEESWGLNDRLTEDISSAYKHLSSSKGAGIIEENYDEDFEKTDEDDKIIYKKETGYEDEDDDKLVDEEFNLTTSGGSSGNKKDSDFLKELMKPPIRTKISYQAKPAKTTS